MWSRSLFQIVKYSLDSWRSSLSKAKCPIHLHEGYMNCEAVNSLNTYTHFIRDPGSLFWWLVTIRRPRCVFVSFSTKWTGISIVEAKYDTFIFALVWRTQTFIDSTSKNIVPILTMIILTDKRIILCLEFEPESPKFKQNILIISAFKFFAAKFSIASWIRVFKWPAFI